MKKILFIYTDGFPIYDIAWAFLELNYDMLFYDKILYTYASSDIEEAEQELADFLEQDDFWFVLSYNFVPIISNVCNQKKLPYVSLTYDSLTLPLHTPCVTNPYNFTYIFDHDEYLLVKEHFHPKHVYYMPLAANLSRLGATVIDDDDIARFSSDVSFVGNLYDTDEYQKLEEVDVLPQGIKDYLDYLFGYYTGRWNSESIYDCMDDKACEILNQFMPDGYKNKYQIADHYYYPMILLSRRIANRDRMLMLEHLSKKFNVTLFGPKHDLPFPITQKGPVEYEKEFAKVAFLSKINLHLTIPRIASGISLRCFDVMASGGFLMANYRADMLELFEPDRDFVMYTNIDELEQKVDYYLHHDDERLAIARNGFEKVASSHTYIHRAKEMLRNLEEAGFHP